MLEKRKKALFLRWSTKLQNAPIKRWVHVSWRITTEVEAVWFLLVIVRHLKIPACLNMTTQNPCLPPHSLYWHLCLSSSWSVLLWRAFSLAAVSPFTSCSSRGTRRANCPCGASQTARLRSRCHPLQVTHCNTSPLETNLPYYYLNCIYSKLKQLLNRVNI